MILEFYMMRVWREINKKSFWSMKLIIATYFFLLRKKRHKWLRKSNMNFTPSHIYWITFSLQIGRIRWIVDAKVFCFYKIQKNNNVVIIFKQLKTVQNLYFSYLEAGNIGYLSFRISEDI